MPKFYQRKVFKYSGGFTLIEILVVVGLLVFLFSIASLSFAQNSAEKKLDAASSDLASSIVQARTKASNSDTAGSGIAAQWGVHLEGTQFTLFKGSVYNSADPNNFVVSSQNVTITPNLPCAGGGDCNNIVFQKVSGEVFNYDSTKNSVCLSLNAKNTLLVINFLGVVDVQANC